MNLYLYIPPHSCHPPGVTKGLIYGAVDRAKHLCSDRKDQRHHILETLQRLERRGHKYRDLIPIFNNAIKECFNNKTSKPSTRKRSKQAGSLYLHLPFNPVDPPSKLLQKAFQDNILQNDTGPIQDICNPGFKQMTICHHGQKNIGSALAPRKLRLGEEYKVSDFLKSLPQDRG